MGSGRGGAGNWISQPPAVQAQKGKGRENEDAISAPWSFGARELGWNFFSQKKSGRGGAGNLYDPSTLDSATKAEGERQFKRDSVFIKEHASTASPTEGIKSGRGGFGNIVTTVDELQTDLEANPATSPVKSNANEGLELVDFGSSSNPSSSSTLTRTVSQTPSTSSSTIVQTYNSTGRGGAGNGAASNSRYSRAELERIEREEIQAIRRRSSLGQATDGNAPQTTTPAPPAPTVRAGRGGYWFAPSTASDAITEEATSSNAAVVAASAGQAAASAERSIDKPINVTYTVYKSSGRGGAGNAVFNDRAVPPANTTTTTTTTTTTAAADQPSNPEVIANA